MKSLVLATCIGVLTFASANAQETPKFTFDIRGGYTNPVGNTSNQLADGWNIGGGFGYNFNSFLGAKLNLDYSAMNVNGATLSSIGVPGGDTQIFSATIDPVFHIMGNHRLDPYVMGGGGLFHVYQEFTAPVVAVTNVYNPFFGLYPVAFGANQILSSYSVNRPGFDVGAGLAFGVWGHAKVFAEVKWDHVYMVNSHIDYLPVSFGFRW